MIPVKRFWAFDEEVFSIERNRGTGFVAPPSADESAGHVLY
jgi:hypothetical protein